MITAQCVRRVGHTAAIQELTSRVDSEQDGERQRLWRGEPHHRSLGCRSAWSNSCASLHNAVSGLVSIATSPRAAVLRRPSRPHLASICSLQACSFTQTSPPSPISLSECRLPHRRRTASALHTPASPSAFEQRWGATAAHVGGPYTAISSLWTSFDCLQVRAAREGSAPAGGRQGSTLSRECHRDALQRIQRSSGEALRPKER